MGDVAGVTAEKVWSAVFEGGIEQSYESGQLSDRGFYEQFCRLTDSRPDYDRLLWAASEIFTLNVSIVPVVCQLYVAGHRLGILSNTCGPHWNYCTGGRYGFLECFEQFVLSYEVGACKPDARIFEVAAEQARVAPAQMFYVDDLPGNVKAARAVGIDAVCYTTTPQLVADLRNRGLRFNY
jgi:putative hydrolase of the HAD superfamily